mmetsp:Transcript_16099/g.21049  ORF Transcript_16099/g.21049 Transcript_16099/m.21049 type:complete len:493 (+) Transcript_16099:270-1748(+)
MMKIGRNTEQSGIMTIALTAEEDPDPIVSNEFRTGSSVNVLVVSNFSKRITQEANAAADVATDDDRRLCRDDAPIHIRFGYRTMFEPGAIDAIIQQIIQQRKVNVLDLMWNPFLPDFAKLVEAATRESILIDLKLNLENVVGANQAFSAASGARTRLKCLGLCLKAPRRRTAESWDDDDGTRHFFSQAVAQGIQQFINLQELRLHLFDFTDESLNDMICHVIYVLKERNISSLWFVTEGILSSHALPSITRLIQAAANTGTNITHLGVTFCHDLLTNPALAQDFVSAIQQQIPTRLVLAHVGLTVRTVSQLLNVYATTCTKMNNQSLKKCNSLPTWLHLRGRGFLQDTAFSQLLKSLPQMNNVISLVVEDSLFQWTREKEDLFCSALFQNTCITHVAENYRHISENLRTSLLHVQKRNQMLARVQSLLLVQGNKNLPRGIWPRLLHAVSSAENVNYKTSMIGGSSSSVAVYWIVQHNVQIILDAFAAAATSR